MVSTTQLNTMRVNSVALCKTTYITSTYSVFVLLTFGGASTPFLALECSMMVGADMIRLTFSQSRPLHTSDVYKSGMTESNLFSGTAFVVSTKVKVLSTNHQRQKSKTTRQLLTTSDNHFYGLPWLYERKVRLFFPGKMHIYHISYITYLSDEEPPGTLRPN